MAPMKSVPRSATVAFSPTVPDLCALGASGATLDASFSIASSLDVFEIDFSRPDSDLDLLSSYEVSEEFHRLSWGTAGVGGEEIPYGLLAGALADGAVCVWNPAPLIRKENTESSVLSKVQKHVGRVRGLGFDATTPNRLASGGDDGNIFIWDLQNPSSPSHFPPLKAAGQEHIVDLSWNRKVQNIMATTSNSGATVVWDLRKQRFVMSIADPNNRRASAAVEWNPDGATQLIVASADDKFPTLQVWDLRHSISPVKELTGHTKGIVTMAWCPIDSGLLLSSGKDCRTLCWDTSSAEIICELPASSNWTFDVQWSPCVAGVLSTSSYDGQVNLYNIEACRRMLPSDGYFGGSLASKKAPKWLKRPVGVCFGFGGKLVSFGSSITVVKIETNITEEEIVSHSKEFEAVIKDPDNKHVVQDFCQRKIEKSGSENEKEMWSFLKMMFEENARSSFLNQLGYSLADMNDNMHGDIFNDVDKNVQLVENLSFANGIMDENANPGSDVRLDRRMDSIDDGADFFNNLSTPRGAVSPQSASYSEKNSLEQSIVLEEEKTGLDEKDEHERAIHNALVVGDFKGCVKLCLAVDRLSDALLFAHVGGNELWDGTMKIYLKKHSRPYWKVFSAVVAHDVRHIVSSRPLNDWKATLAMIFVYAGSQEYSSHCNLLAERLERYNTHAAIVCYICAANLEGLARLWYQEQLLKCNGAVYIKKLQEIVEQVVVLAIAKGEKHIIPTLATLVTSYAELLISQGLVGAAMDYLDLLPIHESPENSVMLKQHISKLKESNQPQLTGTFYPSPVQDWSQTTFNTPREEPAYNAPRQEPSFSQPGVFYPTPPDTQSGSQPPPSVRQVPARSTKSIYSSGVASGPLPSNFSSSALAVPPTQFATNGKASARTDQNSSMDWANPSSYGIPGSFQPLGPSQSATNIMFPATNQPVLATPIQHGFMPVSNAPRASLTQQQPHMATAPMEPQRPQLSSQHSAAPTFVSAGPVTIQTVDISGVADDLKPVIATLSRLYNETAEALGGAGAIPAKKREIDDNSRKIGGLFAKLNKSDISPNARVNLVQICQSLDAGDYATATQLQMSLVTSDWDECGSWLVPLKRMIKTRQGLR